MRNLALLLAACRGYQTPLEPTDTAPPSDPAGPLLSTPMHPSTSPQADTATVGPAPGPNGEDCRISIIPAW